jgi:Ca2+-binding RTX toxin-like protein
MRRTILFATLAAGLLAFVGRTAFAAVVQGTPGADDLAGGNAPDTLLGGPGKDSLDGRGGDDPLRGEEGDDTFTDLAGDDILRGGLGDDTLGGNPGDDAIAVPGFGPGPPGLPLEPDAISCGPGRDRVVAQKVDRVAGDCEEVDRLGSGN